MKRLTIRNSDGSVSQPIDSTVEKVFNKLAEYEDTGMTPDEIESMKKELKTFWRNLSLKIIQDKQ